jgi:hypothetical protein
LPQRYDVSLKTLFLCEGDGTIKRLLFGARVLEHLNAEQPQVFHHRADMVVRTEDGLLHQVEFQVSNEAGFGLRMLEYYSFLARQYGEHVVQTVLYLGREPLRGMQVEEPGWAAGALLLLPGIVGLEETVGEKLKEVCMIHVMENKVLGRCCSGSMRRVWSGGRVRCSLSNWLRGLEACRIGP